MLNLAIETPARWLDQVRAHLEDLIVDHGHCEKKAAGVAMNLLFSYVDDVDLVRTMAEIVEEELSHFRQVLDLCTRRGIRFRRIPPSLYGAKLHETIRKSEPERAIDRLLVAALIEARSCERFGLLRDALAKADPELSAFFGSLFESEARHHGSYVRLALTYGREPAVKARLKELAEQEAAIVAEGDPRPRMHS